MSTTDEYGIYDNRLPQTAALDGRTLRAALGDDVVSLRFDGGRATWSHRDGTSGADGYDAVEVRPNTFFIDIWRRSHDEREALTLVADLASGGVLSVLTTVGEAAPGEPRVGQSFAAGTLDGMRAGSPPAPTRDLVGKRLLSEYLPDLVYEHVYLNTRLCAWQCVRGEQPGHGDCDEATYWRFADGQYVFAFRERLIPCASVIFLDLAESRSTGKFLAIEDDGRIGNGGIGARLHLLPDLTYPDRFAPA